MENSRIQHILTIVDTAISLTRDKRSLYLEDVCGNDEELRYEVEELLRSITESEGFWEGWTQWNERQIRNMLRPADAIEAEHDLKQIGHWRLIKPLGEGGMGVIYLAERADGMYNQMAAIKLLHRGLEVGESIRRFEQERHILASLDHPNIAGLFDGGVTEDARPWLAMEYVDGIPITTWCREYNATLKQRLDLFEQVCKAVRYAHRNLIVHRDLKPENILVAKDGIIKVLDFGIAKLLDDELSPEQRLHTQTGLRVMSLDYAAPEQIDGESVTTATDVHGLGMLLFELLTGKYPFDLQGLKRVQIEQVLRNQTPDKPSSVTPDLRSRLRGDLDAIVLKALRKEPGQRYENAGQLLDDIERYHSYLPVVARRDTFRYRLGKFYKRYRGKVVASTIILTVLITLITYYTYRITEERNAEKIEVQRANQVTDFLISIFNYSNPTTRHSSDITAREILDNSTVSIHDKLKDQPGTQARLYDAVGQIYQNLGLLEKARNLYSKALVIGWEQVKQAKADSTQLAFIYTDYGDLYRDLGKYDSASGYLNKAVELDKLDSEKKDQLAMSLASLAWVELLRGHLTVADSLYQETLRIQERLNGRSSLEYAAVLQQVGWLEQYRGNSAKADSLFRVILPIREKFQGNDHPDVATLLHSMGWISYKLENYDEAIKIDKKALALRKKIFGEKHPDIAWTMNNLAIVELEKGNTQVAGSLLSKSFAMRRELLGEQHPLTMQSLGELARVHFIQKNYAQAINLYRQVLKIHRKVLGDTNRTVVTDLNNLSVVLYQSGNTGEALKIATECVRIAGDVYDNSHPVLFTMKRNKAKLLEDLGRFEEAEFLRVSSFNNMRKAKGLNDNATQQSLEDLIALYKKWNRPEKLLEYTAMRTDSISSK